MRKLAVPTDDPIEVYDTCVAAVADATLRRTYVVNQAHMVQAVVEFDAATVAVSWASLPRTPRGNLDLVIVGGLTKKKSYGSIFHLYGGCSWPIEGHL